MTGTLNQLDPAIQELPAAGRATLSALDRLRSASPAVVRLLAALKAVAPALTATIPALDTVMRQARPAVAYLAPYALDIGSLLAGLDGEGSYRDANGAYARVIAVVASSPLVTLTGQQQALVTELAKVGAIQLSASKGINPYPAPDTAGDPAPLTIRYPRIQEDPAP